MHRGGYIVYDKKGWREAFQLIPYEFFIGGLRKGFGISV